MRKVVSRLNFDLKSFLKNLKLNESNISMVLGALVIVVVGVLVVNYFKDRGGVTLNGLTTEESSEEVHIVAKGETLWSIAEDSFGSGYNWVDLMEANGLTSEMIEVGQKIVVPDVAAKQPTVTEQIATEKVTTSIGTSSYSVVKGDTLWDIAVRAYGDGFKWVEIAKVNKLTNPNLIYTGDVLTLPR